MEITKTSLSDCIIIKSQIFTDSRGYFFECYNDQHFNQLTGLKVQFVQDNQSFSTKGVLRGLHLQSGEHAQAKLVRVLKGEVLDVAVDLRKNSPTYGKYESVILSEDNKLQFFVPRGFAHGFVVLSDVAEFFYKVDNYYHKEAEVGIHYADPTLNIDWQLPAELLKVSDKDAILPFLAEISNHLS